MKLEALEHPKTLDLASFLEVELPTAIGHLELLWAFVAKTTPQGNVGKYSDAVIADKARWRGKPSAFIAALIEAGFLDIDPQHRLIVHDWHEHCPNWVRAKLKRDSLNFALKSPLKTPLKSGTEDQHLSPDGETYDRDLSPSLNPQSSRARVLPSLAKPNQAKPSGENADSRETAIDGSVDVPREASVDAQAGTGVERDGEAEGTHRTRAGLSETFGDFAMTTYPPCTGRRSWSTALHHAGVIVSAGKATEEDLRRRLSGYRAKFDAGDLTPDYVYTPQNWFDHLADDPPCFREWTPAPSKAQQQQDANIEAGRKWLAGGAG